MTRDEAARVMGVATPEVTRVEAETEHGVVVAMSSGARRLIGDDGFYALDEHPANTHLRRFRFPVPEVAPGEGGDQELDEGDPDGAQVPDGTVDEVLAWVGSDPERAIAAREHEQAKPSPRKSLIERLEKVQ